MTFLSAMEKREVWNSTGARAPMYTFLKRVTQVNEVRVTFGTLRTALCF